MLLRFTKSPPAASADTLLCLRPDGTSASTELPRQGILPQLAIRFVVESTLGWPDALFGRVSAGHPLSAAATAATTPATARQPSPLLRSLQAAALASCLEAEQWAGASAPAAFTRALAAACRSRGVPPPAGLLPADVDRLRLALREFGAAWRPLSPGQSLERTFAP